MGKKSPKSIIFGEMLSDFNREHLFASNQSSKKKFRIIRMKMFGNSIYFFCYSHRSHRYVNRYSLSIPYSHSHLVPFAKEKKLKPAIIWTVEMLLFTSLVVDKRLCYVYTQFTHCYWHMHKSRSMAISKWEEGQTTKKLIEREKKQNTCVCEGAKYFRIKDKSVRLNWNSAVWLLELLRILHSIKSFCMQ